MKSFKLLLSLIVLAAVAAAPVVRADTTSPTAAQETKIKELQKEEAKELKTLKADAKTKDADKKTKAAAIKKDFDAKIAAVKAGS